MNTTQLDAVTRRLQGRHLATIDNVVGMPGEAPAIVITWVNQGVGKSKFYYDNGAEYHDALQSARRQAWCRSSAYDVIDNTP